MRHKSEEERRAVNRGCQAIQRNYFRSETNVHFFNVSVNYASHPLTPRTLNPVLPPKTSVYARADIQTPATMASPQTQQAQQPNGHTSPPPASATSKPQPEQPQPPTDAQPTTAKTPTTAQPSNPDVPLTSLTDDGTSKRPRDARLLHLVLSAQGIHSYQERVPLQLLDFAYRYTSSVLSDSLRLAGEGYTGPADSNRGGGRGRGAGGGNEGEGSIGVTALRQGIASRQDFAFSGGHLPKEFMLEQAAERNRVGLPRVERGSGLVLPPEKFCLTGAGWGLKDNWEESEDEDEEMEG